MLLKLIKTREMPSGIHCEVLEVNPLTKDRILAKVFVMNELLPLELYYSLTISWRGICIQGRHCGWQWEKPEDEKAVIDYLKTIQATYEEIRLEVCGPKPQLPGYPEVDRNPEDYPITLLDDLDEDEKPEGPFYELEDPDLTSKNIIW